MRFNPCICCCWGRHLTTTRSYSRPQQCGSTPASAAVEADILPTGAIPAPNSAVQPLHLLLLRRTSYQQELFPPPTVRFNPCICCCWGGHLTNRSYSRPQQWGSTPASAAVEADILPTGAIPAPNSAVQPLHLLLLRRTSYQQELLPPPTVRFNPCICCCWGRHLTTTSYSRPQQWVSTPTSAAVEADILPPGAIPAPNSGVQPLHLLLLRRTSHHHQLFPPPTVGFNPYICCCWGGHLTTRSYSRPQQWGSTPASAAVEADILPPPGAIPAPNSAVQPLHLLLLRQTPNHHQLFPPPTVGFNPYICCCWGRHLTTTSYSRPQQWGSTPTSAAVEADILPPGAIPAPNSGVQPLHLLLLRQTPNHHQLFPPPTVGFNPYICCCWGGHLTTRSYSGPQQCSSTPTSAAVEADILPTGAILAPNSAVQPLHLLLLRRTSYHHQELFRPPTVQFNPYICCCWGGHLTTRPLRQSAGSTKALKVNFNQHATLGMT